MPEDTFTYCTDYTCRIAGDRQTSMFLSPDNYIQAPDNSQSFNRYAYCLNNPLKYTDPNGDFFWLIPNIGWSKEESFNIGISIVVGLPGLISAQTGISYNLESNTVCNYVGTTFAMNTAYMSCSLNGGVNIGYTAGLSPFSGLPISTNFGTVGINYDITNDCLSGNISAWQVDKSGFTFNPSISVMVYPEHTTNLVRGQGFKSNDAVLNRFVKANDYQGALDYFGFEGEYKSTRPHGAEYVDTDGYYGCTNPKTGMISFGDLAFDSYDNLRGTYEKERFHRNKVLKGETFETFDEEGLECMKYFPEEAKGHLHAGYNNGLYPKATLNYFQLANSYWLSVHTTAIRNPHFYDFIFKIPRKW
ncbi:MAG: hypothetical protein MJZ56_04815 [Bacteroidales bacterium]|nr:hypothetical protein [Bacteroidales bacterium]